MAENTQVANFNTQLSYYTNRYVDLMERDLTSRGMEFDSYSKDCVVAAMGSIFQMVHESGVNFDATTKKINHLLDILSLSDVKKKKISNLSGGMKRRVGIAQAMLNDPEILVMDEPTAGLDPGERVRLRNFISEFSHDRIVLISTHIVSDIEYISTRNAIMKAGEIVDVGTTAELVKQIEGKVWNCTIPASKLPECEMRLHIINQRGEDHNQVSIRYLSEHSEIDGSVTTEPRLEDLYLWLFPQTDLEKEER